MTNSKIQQTLQSFRKTLQENPYPPLPTEVLDVQFYRFKEVEKQHLPTYIFDALTYIHRNLFKRQLTVAYLKKECNISRSFASYFKLYVGKGPKKYINVYRIEAAARLLEDPELQDVPLSNIAGLLGYAHTSTFSKAFKRITDTPPSRWREHYGR